MDEFLTTWTQISDHEDFVTYRFRVPGGWIVAVRDSLNGDATQILFISNPDGNWELGT